MCEKCYKSVLYCFNFLEYFTVVVLSGWLYPEGDPAWHGYMDMSGNYHNYSAVWVEEDNSSLS